MVALSPERAATPAGETAVHKLLGLNVLSLKQQPPYLRQGADCIRIERVLLAAGPHRNLVENYCLRGGSSVRCDAYPSVSQRQTFDPFGRGSIKMIGQFRREQKLILPAAAGLKDDS